LQLVCAGAAGSASLALPSIVVTCCSPPPLHVPLCSQSTTVTLFSKAHFGHLCFLLFSLQLHVTSVARHTSTSMSPACPLAATCSALVLTSCSLTWL
jgi:hypothetical protein